MLWLESILMSIKMPLKNDRGKVEILHIHHPLSTLLTAATIIGYHYTLYFVFVLKQNKIIKYYVFKRPSNSETFISGQNFL